MSWELNCRNCRARYGGTTSTTACSGNPTPIIGGADAGLITWAKTFPSREFAIRCRASSASTPMKNSLIATGATNTSARSAATRCSSNRRMIPTPRPPPSRRRSVTCAGSSAIAPGTWRRGMVTRNTPASAATHSCPPSRQALRRIVRGRFGTRWFAWFPATSSTS